ncbi:MAG: penicillin-binding protein 2 [Acidobacteria bacterium]|nr:penicillin-binding protein 2 [Acidobacteriota bacterium]
MVIRLVVIQYAITAIFAVLALSFWWVQVIEHQRFYEMAENNHQRTLALRAPRGVLYDREGRPLVENRDSFHISIVREHTKDLARTIRLLAAVTGVNEQLIRQEVDRQRREPVYRPITVIEDASLPQVAAVTARRFELPDVIVERVPVRRYPPDALAAHAFGYVGEAGERELAAHALPLGAIVGQSGIERAYNELLMGEDGARRVVVNSVGREIRTIEEIPPAEGRRVRLTIDYDLQRGVEDGFRELGFNGAAVVLDPNTGEVLALVSLPAYDPNAFAAGIDRETWTALNVDNLKPLQNRAIQGRYSPGSTFKIAVATAALQEGIVRPDFRVHCSGGAYFYGQYFQCHLKGGHGSVDMRQAIEKSCNVYFYTVGNMVGVDRIHKWATALGLGERSGIDLPNEVEGLVPSTEWKRRQRGEKWYPGETISVAIGQGQVSVTPISMAVMIATVANGGMRLTPHFVKAVDEGKGWQAVAPPGVKKNIHLKPETVKVLHDGLWLVVNGAGTGARGRIPGRNVAGKTGTAQVISIEGKQRAGRTDKDLRDHGWFVFFAPKDNPQVAGVIFAEHAEHGYFAAPIARHVVQTVFAKKEGRSVPPFDKSPFLWTTTTTPAVGGQ